MLHEFLALTFTEWIAIGGLVATTVVGVAAALAPSITARETRSHERELERSKRLYAQRHGAYLELSRFLERQRLILERAEHPVKALADPPPPDALDDEAWMDMRARWTTLASADVRDALNVADDRFVDFVRAVFMARSFDAIAVGDDAPKLPEVMAKVEQARTVAIAALDAAEEKMNTELAEL